MTVENALRLSRLEDENRELRHRLGKHELVGSGPAMKKLITQIERVAASETRVCILGETGTGKELVARAIHEKSPRRENPFITLNCAAVPAELIESELFGHEKGAFTGAAVKHLGKFEQADGGTLFLDEIGDMPVAMQAKLLRVLEEGEVERVGGDKPIKVNVRVLVATHRNLEELVKQNAFRRDLFHRIYVFPLTLPPLHERKEDFPELVAHFARQVAAQNGWKEKIFADRCHRRIAQIRLAWKCPRIAQCSGAAHPAGFRRRCNSGGCSAHSADFGFGFREWTQALPPEAPRARWPNARKRSKGK